MKIKSYIILLSILLHISFVFSGYFPVQGGSANDFSSPFGPRNISGFDFHDGLDIGDVNFGENIINNYDGEVWKIDEIGAYHYIIIYHEYYDDYTRYLHVNVKDNLSEGDNINGGDIIGTIRDEGYDPHLHFEYYYEEPDIYGDDAFTNTMNPANIIGNIDPPPILVDQFGYQISGSYVLELNEDTKGNYFKFGVRTNDDELDIETISIFMDGYSEDGTYFNEKILLSDDNYDDPDILKNEIDYSSRTNCKEEEPSNIECLKIDPKSFSREDLYHTVYLKWYINENVWYTLNDNPTLEINVYDVNNAGNVTYANTLSIITSIEGGPDGSPGPPTLISVIYDQSANNIKLEYEPDLSEPYPEYCAIYRCPANENIDDSDQIGITSNNYEYYDDSGELIPGNEYKYAVAGVNVVGEGYNSNTKCAIFGEELENIISNNLSLDGSYYSNGTIVENGVTLDIDPGSEINFAPNASLEVNGTLDAQGTESEPIVFNSSVTWDGINLVNTSNSNLKYCEIKNASNGIFISDCDPDIEQCYIHNNTSDGINMINYASPYLYHNTISNNSGDGVYCYNYCNPTFTNNSSNPGYNEIKNNGNIGIIASGNSAPLLGISAAGQQVIGDNSIHGNSWADAVGASYSTISAEWCYWDGDPDSTTSGDVVYYNPLDDDPCDPGGGSGLAKSSIKFTNQDYFDPECVNENDPLELLQHALYNNSGAKYEEAVKTLKKLIKEFPNNGYSATGLGLLYKISRDKNNMDIASYCKDNILAKTSSDLLKQTSYEILISKAIRNKDNKTAIQYCQRILEKYPNTNSEAYALYNMCILFQDSNKETSEYLETMKNKYSNHPLTFYARSLLGENVEWSKAKQHQFERPKTAVAEAPETFEFLQPSPNPFNPTTNIRFALPEAAKVNISVYNILGEKVWTYKSNKFEAGYHSIAWHSIDNSGHRVSSGIYIIRIRSENQQATQKVMLMK